MNKLKTWIEGNKEVAITTCVAGAISVVAGVMYIIMGRKQAANFSKFAEMSNKAMEAASKSNLTEEEIKLFNDLVEKM